MFLVSSQGLNCLQFKVIHVPRRHIFGKPVLNPFTRILEASIQDDLDSSITTLCKAYQATLPGFHLVRISPSCMQLLRKLSYVEAVPTHS